MRILYHHRTQAEDGQAVHIRRMIAAFQAGGHEVHEEALVLRASGPDRTEQAPEGEGTLSKYLRVPKLVREVAEHAYTYPATRKLVTAGRQSSAELLYERHAFGNLAGARASTRLGIPHVLEVNSPMTLELQRTRGLVFPRWAERSEKRAFQAADVVCTVTRVLGDMLVDMGVDPARILVTPNGVDLEAFAHPDRAAARQDLGLREEPLVLGFVGWVRDWHRLDLVLDAMTDPALSAAELAIIGGGPAIKPLEEHAQALGLRDRLHVCGPRRHDRIPGLLPAFDIALVPAINPYASPLKLHEYMAARLPIVAPSQPNLREVLVHEDNALLVQPGDASELGGALVRLALDGPLRDRLGTRARESVEVEDLTWAGNVRRVLARVAELGEDRTRE